MVGPGPAPQDIIAAAAIDDVIAVMAADAVRPGIAGQRVGHLGPCEILDAVEGVAFGIAAAGGVGLQVHRDRDELGGVVDHVAAGAADQMVGPASAPQEVVAGAAVDGVGPYVAGQGVVERRAGHVLDRDERVALGVAARGRAGHQADHHRRRRARIVGRVDAVAAIEQIAGAQPGEHVIAGAAMDGVEAVGVGQIARIGADEGIIAVGAVDGLGHGCLLLVWGRAAVFGWSGRGSKRWDGWKGSRQIQRREVRISEADAPPGSQMRAGSIAIGSREARTTMSAGLRAPMDRPASFIPSMIRGWSRAFSPT